MDRFKILDDISEPAYVADCNTYDIIYLNNAAKHELNLTDLKKCTNTKCYNLLHNRKKICNLCPNKLLTPNKVFEWENYNAISKKFFSHERRSYYNVRWNKKAS